MSINYDKNYEEQLREMSDILELINYRPRTIESYLRSISECCEWLGSTFGISIDEATVSQLRSFLAYLHRPASDGGREFKPRSVNIYNCAIKKYFRYVLRKDLSNRDLPTMRVDNPLPRVPSQNFDYLSLTSASVNCQDREHPQEYAAKEHRQAYTAKEHPGRRWYKNTGYMRHYQSEGMMSSHSSLKK